MSWAGWGTEGGLSRWRSSSLCPHGPCPHGPHGPCPHRLQHADLVLAVLDATTVPTDPAELGAALGSLVPPATPCILVLNKADLLGGHTGALCDSCTRGPPLPPTTLLSCKTGEGTDRLLQLLGEQLAQL